MHHCIDYEHFSTGSNCFNKFYFFVHNEMRYRNKHIKKEQNVVKKSS